MASKPESQSEKLATSIAISLFEGQEPEPMQGLYLGDVQLEVSEFEADAQVLAREVPRRGEKIFPMQRRQYGLVPVALRYLRSPRVLFFDRSVALEDIEFVRINEARDTFRNLVVGFLFSRVQGVLGFLNRSGPGGLPVANAFAAAVPSTVAPSNSIVGFRIDVATKTVNVRIHSSLIIRRNWSYFGYYAGTPVVGNLLGGVYEFGIDGPGLTQVQPDLAHFDIPYKTLQPRLTL